jgi:hypothetical protein
MWVFYDDIFMLKTSMLFLEIIVNLYFCRRMFTEGSEYLTSDEKERRKRKRCFFVKWKLVNDFYLYKKGCRYTHPRKIKQKQNKLSRCQDDASDKMIVVRNRISTCTQDYFIYRAQKTQRFPLLSLWHWKAILKRYYYTLFNIDI